MRLTHLSLTSLSFFLRDLRFRELVRTLLAEHPVHLDPTSLAYFMHAFSETEKLNYLGEMQDGSLLNLGKSMKAALINHSGRYHVSLHVLQRG